MLTLRCINKSNFAPINLFKYLMIIFSVKYPVKSYKKRNTPNLISDYSNDSAVVIIDLKYVLRKKKEKEQIKITTFIIIFYNKLHNDKIMCGKIPNSLAFRYD